VGLVLATRAPAGEPGLDELALAPLDRTASLELLRRRAPDLSAPVAEAVAEAAAGNPLALAELPATLSGAQRSGVAALPEPLAPGERLRAAFAGRIGELDPAARRALVVAAAYAGSDLATLARACGPDAEWLAAAEERGLLRLGPADAHFAHPLIRGAAYHGAGPAERRAAHRALAGALAGEHRAWHLAAATIGTDTSVAAELERAAEAAAARRGFAAASAAFERAAHLSPDRAEAARRLLAAGEAAGAAGAPERALALWAEVGEGPLRARAHHLRGRLLVWAGGPGEATALLVEEAEATAERDPVLAAVMLADAANGCTATNDYHRALALAERAVAVLGAGGAPEERAAVLAMHGWALLLRGRTAQGREVMRTAERLAAPLDPLGPHWPWLHLVLRTRIPLGELERAERDGLALADRAREAGALATLGGGLIVAAEAALRLGHWATVDAATAEAIQVAGDTAQRSWHGQALVTRARLAGARGETEAARELARTARGVAVTTGISTGLRFVHASLGFVELSAERVPEAIAELEAAERLVAGSGHEEPMLSPWAPDLAEAYVRGGRPADARRVLETLERHARLTGLAFPAAAAARARGMLDDAYDAHFARALAHEETLPFERARTLLAHGRRLHRARRRAEARERLREAHAGFERLGAAAWTAQAEHELRAAGARRRRAPAPSGLTPQELRVVAAVRRGASNREIATELFLAPKTVEFHLRQIYRKVGVRSRTQLVAALPDER
jgi:DNA-binding CsgD family transcriptional regulator